MLLQSFICTVYQKCIFLKKKDFICNVVKYYNCSTTDQKIKHELGYVPIDALKIF